MHYCHVSVWASHKLLRTKLLQGFLAFLSDLSKFGDDIQQK